MRDTSDERELSLGTQMTPMIDIVFQLLVFFIMTFQISMAEGDFHIKMPLDGPGVRPSNVAWRLRLEADDRGRLVRAAIDGDTMDDWDLLQDRLIAAIGNDRGPGSLQQQVEVLLDCDYGLRYEHVMDAITAVSGHRDAAGNIIPLVERISFSPPRSQ